MTHSFGKDYWEQHWDQAGDPTARVAEPGAANPHLVREVAGLTPGTALDAGCGAGAEALWLAERGWQVTAADISRAALAQAALSAPSSGTERVDWVEADLTSWDPQQLFDLVVTNYAHPAIPQLAFYDRLSSWVAPGGTLLIVGHLHAAGPAHGHGQVHGSAAQQGDEPVHGNEPPVEATVTLADITARLDPRMWRIDTAEEQTRERPGGQGLPLHDVIVRARRLR
jgi:SAM-dependent methyltransferase